MTVTEQQIKATTSQLDAIRRLKRTKRRLELEKARMLIADPAPSQDVERIILCVAKETGISRQLILSRLRIEPVAVARQIAMTLAYELDGASSPRVGAMFKRDHGAVLHAKGAVQNRCDTNLEFAAQIERLRQEIKTQQATK